MKRYLIPTLFAVIMIFGIVMGVLPAKTVHTVHAAGSGTNLDRSVILYNGHQFFDGKIDGGSSGGYKYTQTDDTDGCPDFIDSLSNGNQSATLHTQVKDPINGGCIDTKSSIALTQPAQSYMPFVYVDANHIMTSDGRSTYTYVATLGLFLEDGGDQCRDTLKVTAGGPTSSSATVSVTANTGNTSGRGTSYDSWADEVAFDFSEVTKVGNCTHYGPKGDDNYKVSTAFISDPSLTNPAVAASTGGGSTSGKGGGGLNLDCEVKWFNPLTWILCPMVELLQGFVNWFDGQIDSMLQINPKFLKTSDTTGAAFYSAWSSMRTISLVFLLIVGLVMVISQAISVGPFDAYTVRKVLPRMIVAVIGIALSWQLMSLMIAITNDLGQVVKGIIQAPFAGLPLPQIGQGTTSLFTAGVGLAFLFTTSFLAAISFLFTAALAVIIAFTVLLLRQIVIMLLVMVAPVAIVLYILPNTEKAWKFWWESFSKALLMYPIIVAFIATGRVFARATASVNHNPIGDIIAFIAYFLPYFLLPATFRLAGGALSTIGGFVNNKGKGGFDRLKNIRQQSNAAKRERVASANLFRGGVAPSEGNAGNWRGRMNRRVQTAALIPGAIATGGVIATVRNRGNIEATRGNKTFNDARELMEKSPEFAAVSQNDDLLNAVREQTPQLIEAFLRGTVQFGNSTEDEMRQAVSTVQQAQRAGGGEAVQAAVTMQLATTGTGYGTSGDMVDTINAAAGGDRVLAGRMLGVMKSSSMQAGRVDEGGAGYVDMMNQMNALYADAGPGADATPEEQEAYRLAARARATSAISRSAIRGQGAQALVSGRRQSAEMLLPELGDMYQEAENNMDLDGALEAAARLSAVRNAAGGATPEIKAALTQTLNNVGVTGSERESVDQQLGQNIENLSVRVAQTASNGANSTPLITRQQATSQIRTQGALFDAGTARDMSPEERQAQIRALSEGNDGSGTTPPA